MLRRFASAEALLYVHSAGIFQRLGRQRVSGLQGRLNGQRVGISASHQRFRNQLPRVIGVIDPDNAC